MGETLGSKGHLGLCLNSGLREAEWTRRVVRGPPCLETWVWEGEGHKEALDTRKWGEVMARGGEGGVLPQTIVTDGGRWWRERSWRTGKNLSRCYL